MRRASCCQSLVGTCAGCQNRPHHGPTATWKDSLQQERHLPRAKHAGAWEGEAEQTHHCEEAERQAAGAGQQSFLSRCSPANWKKMRAGERAELKAFYSPGVFLKKVLLEGYSHHLSGYLNNFLT